MNTSNIMLILGEASYPVGEHTDKIAWLLDNVVQLPFAAVLLAFLSLGLYWAWTMWGEHLRSVVTLSDRRSYLQGLHQSLSNEQESLLMEISGDYVDSKQKLGRREHHIKELHYRLALKQDEVLEYKAKCEQLEQDLAATGSNTGGTRDLEAAYQELNDELAAKSAQLEKVRASAAQLGKVKARNKVLMEKLGNKNKVIVTLRSKQSEKVDTSKFEEQIETLNKRLKNKEANIVNLRSKLNEQVDTSKFEEQIEALNEQLKNKDTNIANLRERLQGKSNLDSEMITLNAQLAEKQAKIDSLKLFLENTGIEEKQAIVDLKSKLVIAAGWESKANGLLLDLTERDRTISSLRDQLVSAEQQPDNSEELEALRLTLSTRETELAEAQQALIVAEDARSEATDIGALFEGEDVWVHDQFGHVYGSIPDVIDDLKEIGGVADVLQEKLQRHGIYRYKQIAMWTDEQIAALGESLSFKDRIDRDMWVNQAVDLHFAHYGEHLTPQVSIYRKPQSNKDSTQESEHDLEHEETSVRIFEGETVVNHHRYGVVFTEAPSMPDDLTKIRGVGKVLEEALNNFGVYRYKQIALWSSQVINEFVEDLPFGDRVTRDDWIEQASDLHERKYGEKAN